MRRERNNKHKLKFAKDLRNPLYPSRLAIKIETTLDKGKTADVRVLNGSTHRFRSQVLSMVSFFILKMRKNR